MADNSQAQAVTSGGTTFADDDIGGIKFPRNKIIHGADGVNDGDVSTANPFPVRLYVGTTALSVGAANVDAGTLRTTQAADSPLGATILVDDAAFTPASTRVLMAGYEFDDAATDSVNEGDAGAARMSANRCQYVMLRDNAGNERGLNVDANGAIAVSGVTTVTTVTTVAAVTSITNALPAGTNAIGKLAANSGVDIGDVDVTSIVPGTGATNLGKAIDTAAGATDTGVAALVVRDDALTTLTPIDGDFTTLRVDSTGQCWVRLGGLVDYTTDAAAPASPVGLASLVIRDDTLGTLTPADGDWAGPARVDSVGALWVRDRLQLADDAAFTPGTSFVAPAGFTADESSTDSVDEGDVGAARMTLDRRVIVTEYPHTTGGLTFSHTVSAASTNATSVKASAGKVYAVHATNVNAAVRYLKLYNKASAPTVGSDTPVFTFALPGGATGSNLFLEFPTGLEFATGIAFALTTEATDAGSTGVSASEHVVHICYK